MFSDLYQTGNTWGILPKTPTTKWERFLLLFKKSYTKYETLEVKTTKYDKSTNQITEVRRITTYKRLKDKEYIIDSNICLNISYKEKKKKTTSK